MSERAKYVQHEFKAQEADNAFLSKALPYDCYYTAIDGGRAANAQIGAARKRRGIRSGLPDWLIVYRNTTLWIERKVSRAESELGNNQRLTAERLQLNGHLWARANSTEDVEAALRAAGIPLRATLGEIRDRIAVQNEHLPTKRKSAPRKPGAAVNQMSLAAYHRMHGKGLV